ncbi:MAG: hypothetical protein Q8P67_04595, partial [archaeon]|nr:hypothetical protein [archaeon]
MTRKRVMHHFHSRQAAEGEGGEGVTDDGVLGGSQKQAGDEEEHEELRSAVRRPTFSTRAFAWHPAVIERLNHAQSLVGHRGCVNRINWNRDATILASGSDDLQVLLWRYTQPDFFGSSQRAPFAPLGRVKTGHTRNIFGVQFLSPDALVTGAMDGEVRHHLLGESPRAAAAPGPGQGPFHTPTLPAATTTFKCHRRQRVKDVEVDPASPHLYWSASEDHTIRQFDSREPHGSCAPGHCRNIVAISPAEYKSVMVSRTRPNYMCAAGDSVIRVYDRRMLSPRQREDYQGNYDALCLHRFTPYRYVPSGSRVFTTHCSFSRDGRSIIANYNGDHLYEFSMDLQNDFDSSSNISSSSSNISSSSSNISSSSSNISSSSSNISSSSPNISSS